MQHGDWITPETARKILPLSKRRIEQMCKEGVFPSAHQPGSGRNAHWKILRSDVLAHAYNKHYDPFG
jgi:hypothetical protein